jgi:hypothetical protein
METFASWNANKFMDHKITHSFAILVAVFATVCSGQLPAQTRENRVPVPIADPSRPVTVRAHLLNGSITVKSGAVKDVIVEARDRGDSRDESGTTPNGMKRVPMTSTGLNIEAENNQVRISTDSFQRTVDLTITVPVKTSLSLKTVNDGNIVVNGVDGEMDIDDVNGSVTLNHVSGSVVAHALNGRVLATLNRVDPKPMAFSSMNGDIDVTLPADTKAMLNMRTDNGEVFSDFDVQLQTTAPQQTVEDNRNEGGKYRVKIDKNVRGAINGGGPEIQLKNFNGNIYIRKAGAKQ